MIELSFPTIKLGKYIKEINTKVKNTKLSQADLIVYGVTNTNGVTVTNIKASDDLGNYTVLGGNQFAYNPYRINVGSIGLTTPNLFGVVSPAYVVFETTKEISSEFLLYYLKSTLGINLIKCYGDRGGVRSSLRFADLKEIDFPNIELEEQKLIMEKVKQIDNKLSQFNVNLSLEQIFSLRQSILQQAVEGKLCEQDPDDEPASVLLEKIKAEKEKLIDEKKIKNQKELPAVTEKEKPFVLPQGWEWCRLGDISNVSSGSTPLTQRTDYYLNGIIPWITSSATGENFIISSEKYITSKAQKECSLTLYPKGTLVMAMYGQGKTRGQISELAIESTINQACAAINLHFEYSEYVKLCCKSFYNKIRKLAHGGNQPNLNADKIKNYVIALPPLAEQQRIVEKVDRLMALCDKLEQEVINAKKYASQLMEAVLQEAFSNKNEKTTDNVIVFASTQKPIQEPLLAAARGTMRDDTWGNLRKRALALVSEES